MEKPNISVLGIGYVGLCTAVGFASKGYNVIASTHDAEKAAKINKGIPPFHEPNLQNLLEKTIQNGYLKCLIDQTEKAVLETDLTFNAVGTPSRPDGSIDLQFIETSSRDMGKALHKKSSYHVVVIKSTVVPGTTQDLVKPILEKESKKKCGPDFGLCMSPEFLRQGSAFEDTMHTDRIVIGEYDKKSGDTLEDLYKDFYAKNTPPTIRTTLSTAELIKYASNSLLATKISFINTIANICEKIPGADVKTVATAMGLDKRIGPLFLNAGLGYGGSCFPKDVKALMAHSKNLGYPLKLLERSRRRKQNSTPKSNPILQRTTRQPRRQTHSNSRLSIQSRHRRHERSTRHTHNKPTNKRRRYSNRLRPSRHAHRKNHLQKQNSIRHPQQSTASKTQTAPYS